MSKHSIYDTNHFEDNQEVEFYNIFKEVKELGCTYFSYILMHENGSRTRFYSDELWQKSYLENDFIKSCPLHNMIHESSTNMMIPWSSLCNLNPMEIETMEARKEFGHKDGLSISLRHNDFKEVIVLSSEYKEVKFDKMFSLHGNKIKQAILQMRRAATA